MTGQVCWQTIDNDDINPLFAAVCQPHSALLYMVINRITCTAMDVLTLQYCGLMILPVFRPVFFCPFFIAYDVL